MKKISIYVKVLVLQIILSILFTMNCSSEQEMTTSIILDDYMPPEYLPSHELNRLMSYISSLLKNQNHTRNFSIFESNEGRKCRDPDYAKLGDQFARFVIKGLRQFNMMLVPIRHGSQHSRSFNDKLILPHSTGWR